MNKNFRTPQISQFSSCLWVSNLKNIQSFCVKGLRALARETKFEYFRFRMILNVGVNPAANEKCFPIKLQFL